MNEKRLSLEDNDFRSVQEFFLGQPASEYQLLGYDVTLEIPGKLLRWAAVVSWS